MDYTHEPTTGTKMLLASGKYFDLANPDPAAVDLEDIAHALSRISRFNAHTRGWTPYTVAQHSVLVMELTQQLVAVHPVFSGVSALPIVRSALLHDAHEAYIGDITYPVKLTLDNSKVCCGRGETGCNCRDLIGDLKNRVQEAIDIKLETILLHDTLGEAGHIVKLADTAALVLEKEAFTAAPVSDSWFAHDTFSRQFDRDLLTACDKLWSHREAKERFLAACDDVGIVG